MDCSTAREVLWPPDRPRLVRDEVAGARRHVDGCRECLEYFQQDRALLDLYDRARRQPAPSSTRASVFEALSNARWGADVDGAERKGDGTPFGRGRLAVWARLGVLPAVVAAGFALALLADTRRLDTPPADDAAVFVEDYLRRAVGEDHIRTNDPTEVRRFLERELGMQLRPLHFAGLAIERVEICLLEGRRGAMIVYKKDGAAVSHYLVPREGLGSRSPALSAPRDDPPVTGMRVVTWRTASVEQALVGALPAEQLLAIAIAGSSER